jgi:hypothetical protein
MKANYSNNSTEYIYLSENSQANTSAVLEAPLLGKTVQIMENRKPRRDSAVQDAVYSHIRAIRRLGRTNINTTEIADALSLDVDEVNRAVTKLKKKGVRGI